MYRKNTHFSILCSYAVVCTECSSKSSSISAQFWQTFIGFLIDTQHLLALLVVFEAVDRLAPPPVSVRLSQ